MKITSTTRIIELTVEESSVTIRRKRTVVRRAVGPNQTERNAEIEDRNADLTTITIDPDDSRKHN
jgi:hypothetical protein